MPEKTQNTDLENRTREKLLQLLLDNRRNLAERLAERWKDSLIKLNKRFYLHNKYTKNKYEKFRRFIKIRQQRKLLKSKEEIF